MVNLVGEKKDYKAGKKCWNGIKWQYQSTQIDTRRNNAH